MIGFPKSAHPGAEPVWPRRRPTAVMSQKGMVASAHALASTAGLRTLASGGNAVDAAVSAAMVAAVVLPASCGFGGDLFAIVGDARPGAAAPMSFLSSGISPRGLSLQQARERSDPGGKTFAETGPLAPSVPGFVSGIFSLLDAYGTRSFAELAESAIGYAADGFPVTSTVVRHINDSRALLSSYETSASVFLPGGEAPKVGQLLKQEALARSIRAIAEGGRDVFYSGAIAREIERYLAEQGGALTVTDFSDHATTIEPPLSTDYRGHTVYETGLPTQGFLLLEALNIIAGDDLAAIDTSGDAAIHLMDEALKRAFADRWAYCGDPSLVANEVPRLLTPEWAANRRATISDSAAHQVEAGELSDGDTTYLCAIDGDGLMISLIISLSGGFGSGVIAGDTGIMLNNRSGHCFNLIEGHPNCYAPGKKTMHTLNCYMIADPAGTPVLVGGTPGGDGQPQWNLQMVTGLIDAGLDVQATVEQPRWTLWPGSYPREVGGPYELRIENRAGDNVIAALESRGHTVVRTGDWGGTGSAQIICRDPATGVIAGGSDPRAEGLAIGL